jgi:transcriptional regulator with XRE-family HTH domain
MKITSQLTDEAVLEELGRRLAQVRVSFNFTQAQLAAEAGVSKRTVERLESGQVAMHLSGFLRVCRALSLLEQFELLLPEPGNSPMAQLKQQAPLRQRASSKKPKPVSRKKWTWGTPA